MSARIHGRRAGAPGKIDSVLFLAILALILASLPRHSAGEEDETVSWNDDVLGLLVFKAGLQDPRGSLASWSEADSSPCNWTGIRCGSASGRVESVSLDGLALSGTIGRGLLKLERLKTLSLSANNLSGNVVPELFRMLDFVDLKKNRLSGELPSPMGASIRYVDLSDNAFTGALARDFFGGGHLLRYLSLSKNRLTGQLSPSLAANQTGLVTLRIAENGFSGDLPDWIGKSLRALQELDLSWNGFQGSIPPSLATLSSLRSLNLAGNNLTGVVPQSLLQLLRLSSLDLSSNHLGGKIPFGLFSSSLQFLNLSRNEFLGDFPIWPPCHALQVVDISGNRIFGEVPSRIAQCSSLQHLNVGWNVLSGGIPGQISQLQRLMFLDLSHNQLQGGIPSTFTNMSSLTVLKLAKNLLVGNIPKAISKCERLVELDLSSNRLSGSIPGALSRLNFLQSLDLAWNNLTGPIPKELVKLESLSSLDVSHNHLDGPIPKGGVFNLVNRTAFQGNSGLCGAALDVACSTVPKPIVLNPNASSDTAGILQSGGHRGKNKIVLSVSAIIAISAAAVIALGIVVVSVLNIRAQQAAPAAALKNNFFMADHNSSPSSSSEDLAIGKLVMFTDGNDTKSEELLPSAHSLLNKEQEIGRGGFGVVYRAAISDGRTFAVKKLVTAGLVKSQLEFEKEVQQLGKIEHPNLVALQGYYWTSRMQLLIYDFVPNGSLYSRLHERTFGEPPLSWSERFKIAQGTAMGLSHLHHSCQPQVIHYDLKSNNILLGVDNRPLISDYGLANLLPVLDRYAISSKFQGALGYMAPEFASQSSKVTEKCDVYGFGIILLELVTGRRPVEYMEEDVVILCDYVRALLNEGRGMSCVEPSLEACPEDEVLPVIKLGLICSSPLPSNRPSMAEVVQILELVRPLPGIDNSNSISRSSSS
ncbi:probable LRR receptor-like serine/threonine-protein kinase IRK [Selaginella moellendorffii]|nr:probable LRR receptor-like serine/threonine-protein kinase IRK [Selaginella moellendorffii]XP_024517611.1 probable LRR receptor-like serine/threonine-protein kinase IRK [Selaginella moellendorffii]XP_024517612.1 probable LRR receptor-like serine/threonine-protein kinase IRK [Selaginella moellendorffii]|eukprot:XP_002988156.2 probable LRR receptor-like serine/threonine-protein kinase IRK [Selaginella moellendorffii]